MRTALVISTYNWPKALNLCLLSVYNQVVKPDEIIIADDGSTHDTKKNIDSFAEKYNISIKHIWQNDEGFRLAKIRNSALKKTNCEYVIFIDGDVILHPRFVYSHILHRRENQFIIGSRVLLSEKISTKSIHKEKIDFGFFSRGIKNRFNAIHSSFLSKRISKIDDNFLNVRGCNMSFFRNDLFLVNGFDEKFIGWGREDSEIVARLLNAGKKKLKLKFGAVQFHLYHKENSREFLGHNSDILNETVRNGRIKATKGLH